MRDVLKQLGIASIGTNNNNIKKHIALLEIDTSHFKKNGSVGRRGKPYTDEEVFVKNSPMARGSNGSASGSLRFRAMRYIPYACAICANSGEWLGKELKLHLDHIDGDSSNNELTNLRFICPNCHQQTDTWGRGKGKESNEEKNMD